MNPVRRGRPSGRPRSLGLFLAVAGGTFLLAQDQVGALLGGQLSVELAARLVLTFALLAALAAVSRRRPGGRSAAVDEQRARNG